MFGMIAQARPRCDRGSHKTVFERTLLPGFATWMIEQIARWEPDYMIPAETKGARVLDAALAYAREELGEEVCVPVIYGSALDYIPSEELRKSRVMIVDDAVRTGANLDRHWGEIKNREVPQIKALACMGCSEKGSPVREDVDCYLRVEADRYMQYLWQLTELVVAPGLPPEVDHFVFELRMERHFAAAWQRLQELLCERGRLTIDGPFAKREQILPITLHFPRLPGTRKLDADADAAITGAEKLRLFPDPDGECVFVVPISLPALHFEGPADGLSREQAQAALHRALGASEIGDALLRAAHTLDPRTVFRAISTAREMDMIAGLAALVGTEMPGATLRAQHEVFERLHGPQAGAEVSRRVDALVQASLAQDAPNGSGRQLDAGGELAPAETVHAAEPIYLDGHVAQSTRGLAERLKELHDQTAVNGTGARRVGLSMPQLARQLGEDDQLLVSRCVDFGLALTTLVPYVDVIPAGNGSVEVQRCYRVSESYRGSSSYRDVDIVRREKSEQALAVICHRLRERCPVYRERPVPLERLRQIVAILRPLVLAEQSLELKTIAQVGKPRAVLLDTIEPIGVEDAPSIYYTVGDEGVEPTAEFERMYRGSLLDLDLDGCTEGIETHVDELASFIGSPEGDRLDDLFDGWAMSTDRRLGLSHVRASLEDALAQLRSPLNLILGGETHGRTFGLIEDVSDSVDAARKKLSLLGSEWTALAEEHWDGGSGRREQRLAESLAAHGSSVETYELASALASAIVAAATLVERLDTASVAEWQGEEHSEACEVADSVLVWGSRLRCALTSLSGEDTPAPSRPANARDAIAAAAEDLLDMVELLGAVTAALTGAFRGGKGMRAPSRRAGSSREITVLMLDIAGSTVHGELREERAHNRWINEGLDLAGQWARALGGREMADRKGDELTIEFEDHGDASVLAAAAILCHTRTLRDTGIDEISWRFHSGVDCGPVNYESNNVLGRCLNRAAKIAKLGDGRIDASQVVLHSDATERCSPELRRQPIIRSREERSLGEHDGQEVRVQVSIVDSTAALSALIARLQGVSERLLGERPSRRESELSLQVEPAPELDSGSGERQTS